MKATRQSLGSHVTHAKAGHKILEVGREEVPRAWFASRVRVGAILDLLRASASSMVPLAWFASRVRVGAILDLLRASASSISGTKAKSYLASPDEQFAGSRPQPSVLYYTNANSLDRQNDQIEA
jgi:hypothetical protein